MIASDILPLKQSYLKALPLDTFMLSIKVNLILQLDGKKKYIQFQYLDPLGFLL